MNTLILTMQGPKMYYVDYSWFNLFQYSRQQEFLNINGIQEQFSIQCAGLLGSPFTMS